MKFNKFLSVMLASSIAVAGTALPVLADDEAYLMDYVSAQYDIERANLTFDDGTATNDIDDTTALQVTDDQMFAEIADGTWFTTENILSFDFRFDNVETGYISIYRKKSNGAVNKQGPLFSVDPSTMAFRTQTGSTKWQTIYTGMEAGKWYTAEIEGVWVTAGSSATIRLYDQDHKLLKEMPGLNLRQLGAGSTNGNPDAIRGANVSIDNVKFISEYPDALTLSSSADEVKAGQTAAVSYTATRLDKAVLTKPAVAWSVYDENNENPIEDGTVTINAEGIVAASIDAPSQNVTVRAAAVFAEGGDELIGTYPISIKSVDVSGEKFDAVTINGNASMKAGTSEGYAVTATKDGADVTSELTDTDIVWSVYDCDDLYANNNKNISIVNGQLTVGGDVLPQKIYIRATSESGNVYGSIPVEITAADSQIENVVYSNACEEELATASREAAADGSKAYLINATTKFIFANQGDYALAELDMKFTSEKSGMVFQSTDGGKINSSFFFMEGALKQETSSNRFNTIISNVSAEKWYHVMVIYSQSAGNAAISFAEYNEDGTLGTPVIVKDISMRNANSFGAIEVWGGTYVDNIKVVNPIADSVEVIAPKETMFAGESVEFTANVSRSGLPIKGSSGLFWTVLDEGGLAIVDETITVDANGVVKVSTEAAPQKITVEAKTAGGDTATASIEIKASDIFEITNIGLNEEKTKVVKIYAKKNFYYDNPVAFIVAIYDKDGGSMKACAVTQNYGDAYTEGENVIGVDMTLPADFNAENDIIKAFVWSGL